MNIKKIVKKIYNKLQYKIKYNKVLDAGERYDPEIGNMIQWFDPCHISRYEFARKYLNKENTALDIACGTGYGTKILSPYCQFISGVDISNEAIKYAKSRYKGNNIKFLNSDFFENKVIADIVISFETIEHIKYENITDIIQQLTKYCNKTLIGSVPYKEKKNNNQHHYFFEIDEKYFDFLPKSGSLEFHYQTPDGQIYFEKPVKEHIQNLIFIFYKFS